MSANTEPTESGEPASSEPARRWLFRYPVAFFLGALGLSLVAAPFEEAYSDGILIEAAGFTLVMLTGLLTLGGRRGSLVLGIALATPALAGRWLNHWRPDLVPAWLFLAPGLVFCVFIVVHLLRFILRAPRVDSEVLCAGVAGYLMVGMVWGMANILVARLVSNAFVFTVGSTVGQSMKGFTAIYYSFMTLTTVGFGDIVPASGAARMLAMTEAITGTFYIALMVARLVSLYYSPGASNRPGGQEES